MTFTFDSSLKLYVYVADAAFVGFALLALLGGIVAVGAKRLIHAVLGLITSLVGVAGIYVYLGTHFIAAMQILIYVGAVSIAITFAVMLARPPAEEDRRSLLLPAKVWLGFVAALFAALGIGSAVLSTKWTPAPAVIVRGTLEDVGRRFLTDYGFVFELISLVLLVAIVGSVVLARRGRGTPGGM
jgi:NADH:ubiquinone oxidoreductase subunit 6 (subunit J)